MSRALPRSAIRTERLNHHPPAIKATQLLEQAEGAEAALCEADHGPPWMLWWIIGVHLSWGVALLFSPDTGRAIVLIGVDWLDDFGFSGAALGAMLLTISTMAGTGLLIEPRLRRQAQPGRAMALMAFLLCPQYFVVLAAFVSDLLLIRQGSFNDRQVDRWLLLAALAPVVWGALLHTAAILERYVFAWKR